MTESWWLKYERAKEHFRDLEAEISRYANTHPYEAVRIAPPKKDPDIRRYLLKVTQQPDPRISVLAGDVVHNLRTSLDHLYVAVTGDKTDYFPIRDQDPWERDGGGKLLAKNLDSRKSFTSAIEGAAPRAKTIIKELQPYAAGAKWPTHPLGIIRRFDNADKHRQLIAITTGVSNGTSYVARRNQVVWIFYWPFCGDDAEVAKFRWDPGTEPPESEMHVHLRGAPRIGVFIPEINGYVELTQALDWAIAGLPDVYRALEKYVRP